MWLLNAIKNGVLSVLQVPICPPMPCHAMPPRGNEMGGNLTWEAPSDPTHAAWRQAPETRYHLVGGFKHVFFAHIGNNTPN